MPHHVEFEKRHDYLFATVTGQNSRETVFAYMQEILERCEQTGCFRVVIHECLEGPRLTVTELYGLLTQGTMRALGKFRAVALVDEQMGETAGFAENVGVNRGLPFATFDNLDDAARWIASDERHHSADEREYSDERSTSSDESP